MKAPDIETLMAISSLKYAKPDDYALMVKWMQDVYRAQIEENNDIVAEIPLRQGQGKAKRDREYLSILEDPQKAIKTLRNLEQAKAVGFDHSQT